MTPAAAPTLAVVTGAGRGIGSATAARLVGAGFEVIATVRRPGTTPEGTHEVLVDLTDDEAPHSLVDAVRGRPLRALINNAGITVPGPVETTPLDAWRRQLEINLFAHVAVVVEPSMTRTRIWAEAGARSTELEEQMSPDQRRRYRPLLDSLHRASARGAERGMPAAQVAEVIAGAVRDPRPRTRYAVGKEARRVGRLVRVLPDRILDRGARRMLG